MSTLRVNGKGSRIGISVSLDAWLARAVHRHLAGVGAHRCRLINFSRTLIRHAATSSVSPRVVAMVLAAMRPPLVRCARGPLLCRARGRAAPVGAVDLTAVVAPA